MSYQRKTEDEYEIQGSYTCGWEMVTTETNRKDAKSQIEAYRVNEPGVPFRIVKKRVKISSWCESEEDNPSYGVDERERYSVYIIVPSKGIQNV